MFRNLTRFFSRVAKPTGYVVVEPSDYVLRNAGDMAMLEVTVTRLADACRGMSVLVLSDCPEQFPKYKTHVVPLSSAGRSAWLQGDATSAASQEFVATVRGARLVAVAGMGGITDAFPDYAWGVLTTLELAIDAGVPTMMFGQGMGPLERSDLRLKAAAVLTRVDQIALREARAGEPLLRTLGVPAARIVTTGDDAIEMAYLRRASILGTGLGVNLRAATYADVGSGLTEQVRRGVQDSARRLGAPLVPIPISKVPGEEDAVTIRQLLAGFDDTSDGGRAIVGSRGVIDQVVRCRVVATGSYHAGVFALACGIPVVGIARSAYYVDKFLGLATQFGAGVEVVIAADQDIAGEVGRAVDALWRSADDLRPRLLSAAERQIALSQEAYRRAAVLAASRVK